MTLKELLAATIKKFSERKFAEPSFEARRLVQEFFGVSYSELLVGEAKTLSDLEIKGVESWVARRLVGVPLAYLAGHKGFYKYDFIVREGVLIPRPETELIVEAAVKLMPKKILDLGCGSGCIGLSIVKDLGEAFLVAVDCSQVACAVTYENAKRLAIDERVTIVPDAVADWKTDQLFDLVVANPPYIAKGDLNVDPAVDQYEPHLALYSGPEGLSAIREWSRFAYERLEPGGRFICEFGAGQTDQVQAIMSQAGFKKCEIKKDLAGIDRTVICQKL